MKKICYFNLLILNLPYAHKNEKIFLLKQSKTLFKNFWKNFISTISPDLSEVLLGFKYGIIKIFNFQNFQLNTVFKYCPNNTKYLSNRKLIVCNNYSVYSFKKKN